ncbi:DUF7289 family protein [Halorubrum sp. DTA98]|uniref:DUF7289 family protein n=1 Tax=Halorubrum sp. DTA98 TaxID=3402163 RepID=UPI003AAE4CFE
MTRSYRPHRSDRAQSDLVGTVLILGLSLLVVTATVVVGAVVLSDRQADADLRGAETSLTSFASKAALVSSGSSESRAVSLPRSSRGSTAIDPDQGRLLIELRDEANGSVEETLIDRPLGGVTYRLGDSAVAYEGGGVWRADGDRSWMVSPPPVHYRGTTFTMPVPLVEGGSATGGNAVVTRGGPSELVYPDPTDPDRRNPLSAATVHVTVESDYYEAWGRFFESRTGGTVRYDHTADRVTLLLATDDPDRRLGDAAIGTATGRFEISGAGGSAFTDSYNSSVGPYSDPDARSDRGRVVAAGDLRLRGGAAVYGDAVAGGSIDMAGSTVHGNASYGDSIDLGGNAEVTGWSAPNASVASVSPIDPLVRTELSSLAAANDNEAADAIDGTTFASTAEHPDAITLSAGEYYLDDVDLDGRTLRLDVSDGDVRLGVDGTLDLSGETVEVVGEGGRVRAFVARDVAIGSGEVTVEGDVASRMWVYGTRDADIAVNGGSFTGVLYAPSGTTGSGTVDVRSGGAVYGAVVGGQTTLQSGGTIHFDTALGGMDPVFGADVPRVTYLHVTGTPVVVDGN